MNLTSITSAKLPQASQVLNSLGKYLYKSLDGSTDYAKSSNMFEITLIVLYEIPQEIRNKYHISDKKYSSLNQMEISLNLTTYASKIRINLIESGKSEKTLGHTTIDLLKYHNKGLKPSQYFDAIRESTEKFIVKTLEKNFEGYEFIF